MKIKDTEYTNFLIGENESLKKAQATGGIKIKQSLNESNDQDDEGGDESD